MTAETQSARAACLPSILEQQPLPACKGRAGTRRRFAPYHALASAGLALVAALCAPEARAEFVSTPVTTAEVGQPYVYEVVASGTGNVLITAPSGLPPWLMLAQTGSGTATLSGTPRPGDIGSNITLRSEDTTCRIFLLFCFRYQVFDITIIENSIPVLIAPGIPDQSAVEGRPFSLAVSGSFTDPDGDALAFTVAGLPQSLSLTAGTISGTPTQADALASPFEITVTADDGKGGRVSDVFELRIAALDRAEISLASIVATPSPALRGAPVEWVFTVENSGPAATDAVDLIVEFAGTPLTFASNPCTLSVVEDRQRLECRLGPVDNGGSASLAVTGSAAQAGDAYVTAEIFAPGAPLDPSSDNNRGTASLNVGQAVSTVAAQTLPGIAATAVTVADFDGDGFDDVAVATGSDEPTAIHLNLENPASLHASLAEARDTRRGLSTMPLSLEDLVTGTDAAAADFDSDGDADLATASAAGAPSTVFLNSGAASMTALARVGDASADSRAVAAADLDGDGFADLVFANAGANSVYLNQGGAGFEQVASPDASPPLASVDVAAVNVIGDTLPDLIVANANGPAMLHENLGGGSFRAGTAIDPGPTAAVATGDFNGDGFVDVVLGRVAPGPSGLPSNPVYLNNGSGGFVQVAALGASPTSDVLTADVNGDGVLDIVAINTTGAHQVFVGDGSGNFSLHPSLFVSRGAVRAVIGSFGQRPQADIAVAGSNGVEVFFNDGRGTLGLGDTSRPVITLLGEPRVTLQVGGTYTDAGATANDDFDGAITPAVDNPVDPSVIGSYTVTYSAIDGAGNAAEPVTRIVAVEAREASGGGGGGAAGVPLLLLVGAGLAVRRRFRRPLNRPGR